MDVSNFLWVSYKKNAFFFFVDTVPLGDIVIRYGNPLNITCNLHKNVVDEYGENASSRLFFSTNNVVVSPDMVSYRFLFFILKRDGTGTVYAFYYT